MKARNFGEARRSEPRGGQSCLGGGGAGAARGGSRPGAPDPGPGRRSDDPADEPERSVEARPVHDPAEDGAGGHPGVDPIAATAHFKKLSLKCQIFPTPSSTCG